ncbi:MAG: ribosome maturation factor RimM [Methylococcales bacterium]|nr:ribosome maturation factor RimM [Methylococcales bacterium]
MSSELLLGTITGAFGIQGWVKVFSHTRPPENIFAYTPWILGGGQRHKFLEGRRQGKILVAHLEGIDSREHAASLRGTSISVEREQLPQAAPGEYYWSDLIGLTAINLSEQELGHVTGLLETGANDVLIVNGEREYLIPFVQGRHVLSVDLDDKIIRVDWDSDF